MSALARCARATALALALLGAAAGTARAGAYFFVDADGEEDWIVHPVGYTGSGGVLAVDVCIDPTSANAAAMAMSVENAVRTWNGLEPTTANLALGASNNLPFNRIDFESVLLHELGHCLGLAHPNLGSESGLAPPYDEYGRATDGLDNDYDVGNGPAGDTGGPGSDGVRGSGDDSRGDDVNVHWFRKLDNDPFGIAAVVDTTTYARSAAGLPPGDTTAAIGSRAVSFLLRGVADTEAVMHQGVEYDEAQRTLGHDDVATLRLAMAGNDELANTSDDYTLALGYAGLTAGCDVVIDFDAGETGFAACSAGGTNLTNPTHYALTQPRIYFNDGFNWFFNDVSNAPKPVPSLSLLGGLGLGVACLGSAWVRLRRRVRPLSTSASSLPRSG